MAAMMTSTVGYAVMLFCILLLHLTLVTCSLTWSWSTVTSSSPFSPRIGGSLITYPPPLQYNSDGVSVTTNFTVFIVNGGYRWGSDGEAIADNTVWLSRDALAWTAIAGGNVTAYPSFPPFVRSFAAPMLLPPSTVPTRRRMFHRIGGTDRTGSSLSCAVFTSHNMQLWSEVDRFTAMSPCRIDAAAQTLRNGTIVVMGGETTNASLKLNDVWTSHDDGRVFTLRTGNAPWTSRSRAAVATLSGRMQSFATGGADGILLLGGDGISRPTSDVWYYDPLNNVWTCMTNNAIWQPRASAAVCVVDNGLIVLTGGTDGIQIFTDAFISVDGGTFWFAINAISQPARYGHMMTLHPDTGHLIISGGSSSLDKTKSHNDIFMSSISFNNATYIALSLDIPIAPCYNGYVCNRYDKNTIININEKIITCPNTNFCNIPHIYHYNCGNEFNNYNLHLNYSTCLPNNTLLIIGTNFNTSNLSLLPQVLLINNTDPLNKTMECIITNYNQTHIYCRLPFYNTIPYISSTLSYLISKNLIVIRNDNQSSIINNQTLFKFIEFGKYSFPELNSISGCQDQGNITRNCNINQTLIIKGKWFTNYITQFYIGNRATSYIIIDFYTLIIKIDQDPYPPWIYGQLMDVYFQTQAISSNQLVNALSIMAPPGSLVPTVTGISGCQYNSLVINDTIRQTIGCWPSSRVTITGSGFTEESTVTFSLRGACTNIRIFSQYALSCVLNDWMYPYDAGNTAYPVVTSYGYKSPFTDTSLNRPLIRWAGPYNPTLIAVTGCDSNNGPQYNQSVTLNCRANQRIYISGTFLPWSGTTLYVPRITIGNYTCLDPIYVSFYLMSCVPDTSKAYLPSVLYTITLNQTSSNSAGAYTVARLTNAVSFAPNVTSSSSSSSTGPVRPGPIVTSVTGCYDSNEGQTNLTFNCLPQQTVRIGGYNLDNAIDVFIDKSMTCTNFTVISSYQLSCVLPTPYAPQQFGSLLAVTVINRDQFSSLPLYAVAYRAYATPFITSFTASSCTPSTSTTMPYTYCSLLLTMQLTGEYLLPFVGLTISTQYNPSRIYYPCLNATYSSFYQMNCTIDVSSFAIPNQVYQISTNISNITIASLTTLTFAFPPSISNITALSSSCIQNSTTVIDCVPQSSITIIGTNFITTSYLNIRINGTAVAVTSLTTPNRMTCNIPMFNDPKLYGGVPLPIMVQANGLYLQTPSYITLTIRPPSVTSVAVSSGSCQQPVGRPLLCPYNSQYVLTGTYLLLATAVIINNVIMNITATPTYTTITFKLFPDDYSQLAYNDPYNVTVITQMYNSSGLTTVGFLPPNPRLTGATGCRGGGIDSSTIDCNPGQNVTVYGEYLFTPLRCVFGFATATSCVSVNSSVLIVTLPVLTESTYYGASKGPFYVYVYSTLQSPVSYTVMSLKTPQEPVITSISGCPVNGGGGPISTTACLFTNTLTITGSWFVNTLGMTINNIQICTSITLDSFYQIRCILRTPSAGSFQPDYFYNLRITTNGGAAVTIVPNAISFAALLPQIYNVTGCAGVNGSMTINCLPSDTITISGINFESDFRVLTTTNVISLSCSFATGTRLRILCRLYTPSQTTTYGTLITIYVVNQALNVQSQNFNAFTMSSIQIPSIISCTTGCNNIVTFSQTFRLNGIWIIPSLMTVILGNVKLTTTAAYYDSFNYAIYSLPSNANTILIPGIVYNLVITDYRNINSTYPANITFITPIPDISSITGCPTTTTCLPGTLLSIYGSNFVHPGSPMPVVTLVNGNISCQNSSWLGVYFLCRLPSVISSDLFRARLIITITVGRAVSRNYTYLSWAPIQSPQMTSVIGCNAYGPFRVSCMESEWLNITGSYFLSPVTVAIGDLTCKETDYISFNYIRCQLPDDLTFYNLGQLYDLTVASSTLSVTRTKMISFGSYSSSGVMRPNPNISRADGCKSNCYAGQLYVISGYYFFDIPQIKFVLSNDIHTIVANVPQTNLIFYNSTSIGFLLPEIKNDLDYTVLLSLYVDSNGLTSAILMNVLTYAALPYPIVTYITGCVNGGNTDCTPGEDIIVNGQNFASPFLVLLYTNDPKPYRCLNQTLISLTQVSCNIPSYLPFTPHKEYGVSVQVSARIGTPTIAISYAQPPMSISFHNA